ncbi:HAD family hydrolase [Micromonospora sp. KC606]|uniref:HAD family hydrolase n=1 Tax=Micromonospora sp. KC606 TaxID=2530379 RepID=UPI00104D2A45|nr:HAD hydrolase-like protein [Micromonospora sp. KC606]TDC83977.1 HAD family hydrolase [Micromonospora sp. KC606]
MPEHTLIDLLAGYDTVVFDLDGVVVDSNELKIAALTKALADLDPNVVRPFLDQFRCTFGRTRREHFASLYAEHLGRTGDFDRFYRTYAGRYAALLAEIYPTAPLCRGASAMLHGLAVRGVPMAVATGTATTEAEQVLTVNGLRPYLGQVLGGERPKHERLREIPGARKVLVGDSSQDRASALRAKTGFVFVTRYALDPRGVRELPADAAESHFWAEDLTPDTGYHQLESRSLREGIRQ